jgi:hypothetical protein
MLEEIKATLVRKKVFEADEDREHTFEETKDLLGRLHRPDSGDHGPRFNGLLGPYSGHDDSASGPSRHGEEPAKAPEDSHPADTEKSLALRVILKLVYALDLKILHGAVRFMLLKDENVNISATNIRDFFKDKIENLDFCKKHECFSINIEDLGINISPSTNNEMIVKVNSDNVMISNSSFPNCLSIFEDVSLKLIIPLGKSLMKNLCNWSIQIECQ